MSLGEYRGRVDDRFLDDERIPMELRVLWAGELVAGSLTPKSLVERVSEYLKDSAGEEVAPSVPGAGEAPAEELEEPETEPPLTMEEAVDAQEKLIEAAKEGLITTAGALHDAQEEIPPEPPLYADPGGPHPPGGLRFDFAWERTVVSHKPADRQREKITDPSSLVPLPLGGEAIAEWTKSQAIWLNQKRGEGQSRVEHTREHRVGEQDYDYLFKRGHLGALTRLYPGDPNHLRFRSPDELHELLLRHGFTDEQATREAGRRLKLLEERGPLAADPALTRLQEQEDAHARTKEQVAKAFIQAMKKKEK